MVFVWEVVNQVTDNLGVFPHKSAKLEIDMLWTDKVTNNCKSTDSFCLKSLV
jgi:hypothetical protein